MIKLISIAVGGGLGALFRYLAVIQFSYWFGREFPYGTLFVNVTGSFLLGVVFIYFQTRLLASANLQVALQVGLLGAFTTFSTFSLETLNLLQRGDILKAVSYVSLSLLSCLLAVWLGTRLGQHLFA